MRKSNLDVHHLIEDCISNNKRAQLKLYELYVKTMYNTCLRIVKDKMSAEDIVQEAFLSAFLSMKDFRNEVPFEAWLRRIVINRSLDYCRKQKNALPEFSYDVADSDKLSTTENEIVYDLERREKLIQHIKDEMMLLPDGYRVIFSLFYFEGFDHEEIGQIMNISASTSRSQLTRAKQRIIENLNQKKDQDAG